MQTAVLSDLSSNELLERCLAGSEEEAWKEFVRRYHPVIAANAIRIARQYSFDTAAMIEDLVQDVYLRLCDGDCKVLREFRCDRAEAIYSFLKVVTANLARDRCEAMLTMKRGSGKVVSLSSDRQPLPAGSEFTNQVENHLFLRRVEDALTQVAAGSSGSRARTIFWLYYRQGFTAREIAAVRAFELSPKGVESLLQRLVRDVRAALMSPGGDGPEGDQSSKSFYEGG